MVSASDSPPAAADGEILFDDDRGPVPVVTLNRPWALNALTYAMALALSRRLVAWREDPAVRAVVIRGAGGGRAFCAGGDIRSLYEERHRLGPEAASRYYWDEYRLNWRLFHFPKPWIALLDGITMGGGVGVSAHGSHRVVTENTVFAMPETGIGLFPDVGATYVLPRLPGATGMYMGLTGARLGAADCLYAGLGTHHVPAARLDELERALRELGDRAGSVGAVDAVIGRFGADPGPPPLARARERIDACFGRETLEEVLAALAAEPTGWGGEQLAVLGGKCPTSLRVTFRALREGARLDFDGCMRMEYRLVRRFMVGHDLFEGIRALILDRDNRPRWRPDRLEEVTAADVEAYFAPLPDGDLPFDWDASRVAAGGLPA